MIKLIGYLGFLALSGACAILILASAANAQSGRLKIPTPEPTPVEKSKGEYVLTQEPNGNSGSNSISDVFSPPSNDSNDVIKFEAALVPIPVSVVDRKSGKSINNLTVKDFELMVDGSKAEIGELFRSDSPVRLALLFDNSSSVTIAREFEQRAAIKFFRSVIRPDRDQAALFSVAGLANLEEAMTKNVDQLINAIQRLPKPEGATALLDGIAAASAYLKDFSGRRVIVIVSDGQDTLSDMSFDKTLKTVQQNNSQVYVVHTNEFENLKRTGARSGNANLRALDAEYRMKTLAAETGGNIYSPIDESELDSAFRQIAAELAQQYVVGYYPENQVKDGKIHSISIKVPGNQNLDVRSRSGYYITKMAAVD